MNTYRILRINILELIVLVAMLVFLKPVFAVDTVAPRLFMQLTNPTNNSTVSGAVNLAFTIGSYNLIATLEAMVVPYGASQPSSTIAHIEDFPYTFYTTNDNVTIYQSSASIVWDTTSVTDGFYNIQFHVTDTGGEQATFTYGFLVHNTSQVPTSGLTVNVLQPQANAVLPRFATFDVEVTDSFPIERAEAKFKNDAGLPIYDQRLIKETPGENRWTFEWQMYTDIMPPGNYSLTIRTWDAVYAGIELVIPFRIVKKPNPELPILANKNIFYNTAFAKTLQGRFLITSSRKNLIWYVFPKNNYRYYLTSTNAANFLKQVGRTVTAAELKKIPVNGSTAIGDRAFRKKMSGYILVQNSSGNAWYVSPSNQKRYYLGQGSSVFNALKKFQRLISSTSMATIQSNGGVHEIRRAVKTPSGTFSITGVSFRLDNPALRIMTDTGNNRNCHSKCAAFSLVDYVRRRGSFAGINGTYFCPPEYSQCAGITNSYPFPVFNSFTRKLINNDRVGYSPGQNYFMLDTTNLPILGVADTKQGNPGTENWATFLDLGGSGILRSLLYHRPTLIKNGKNILNQQIIDSKERSTRSSRGIIGWKGKTMYLIVVSRATIPQAAAVAQSMGLDNAFNLDGGGSSALYHNGKYLVGPGRKVPNVILVVPQ